MQFHLSVIMQLSSIRKKMDPVSGQKKGKSIVFAYHFKITDIHKFDCFKVLRKDMCRFLLSSHYGVPFFHHSTVWAEKFFWIDVRFDLSNN